MEKKGAAAAALSRGSLIAGWIPAGRATVGQAGSYDGNHSIH
jgi:hypothetical protein